MFAPFGGSFMGLPERRASRTSAIPSSLSMTITPPPLRTALWMGP